MGEKDKSESTGRKVLDFRIFKKADRDIIVTRHLSGIGLAVKEDLIGGTQRTFNRVTVAANASQAEKLAAEAENKRIAEREDAYIQDVVDGYQKLVSMLDEETYGALREQDNFIEDVSKKSDLFKLFEYLESLNERRTLPNRLYASGKELALHMLKQEPNEPTPAYVKRWRKAYDEVRDLDPNWREGGAHAKFLAETVCKWLMYSLDRNANAAFFEEFRRAENEAGRQGALPERYTKLHLLVDEIHCRANRAEPPSDGTVAANLAAGVGYRQYETQGPHAKSLYDQSSRRNGKGARPKGAKGKNKRRKAKSKMRNDTDSEESSESGDPPSRNSNYKKNVEGKDDGQKKRQKTDYKKNIKRSEKGGRKFYVARPDDKEAMLTQFRVDNLSEESDDE